MTRNDQDMTTRLTDALAAPDASMRLQAALSAGTHPEPGFVPVLIARNAEEPDFFVRDMLTWALTRQNPDLTVPRLLAELRSVTPQARSQALHTLSKIGDRRAWPALTHALLHDPDDEVARAAWRTAVGLAPDEARPELAETLATQLGRGDRELQRSLSRALAELGDTAGPVLRRAAESPDSAVRLHAIATERIVRDPEEGFDTALHEARRLSALRAAPTVGE
ncbi:MULTISPECIES: HEAT repeat domain-containing protein [Bacteria]|uniref:HEAT repeat domain-containing protein n=1 Tax=Bacteria TaxID=2 RepID=UPI003C7BB70E